MSFLFIIILIIIIGYTLYKLKIFRYFNLKKSHQIQENFKEHVSQEKLIYEEEEEGMTFYAVDKIVIKKNKKYEKLKDSLKNFNKGIRSTLDMVPCNNNNSSVNPRDTRPNYIPHILDDNSNIHILLTNNSLYYNNVKFVKNNKEFNFKKSQPSLDNNSIIEQLKFNVYSYIDIDIDKSKKDPINYSDLIGIIPEYYLDEEFFNEEKKYKKELEEEEEEEEGGYIRRLQAPSSNIGEKQHQEDNIFDYIRYIGAVSYTYYYFLVRMDTSIFSIHDPEFPQTIYIVYDENMVNNSKNIVSTLKLDYKHDKQLNFIKDYLVAINPELTDINFTPIHIDKIGPIDNLDVILGNNNYSKNIRKKLGLLKSSNPTYNIMGFDEHSNTMFTDNTLSTDFLKDKKSIHKQKIQEEESIFNKEINAEINRIYNRYEDNDIPNSSFNYDYYARRSGLKDKTIRQITEELLKKHNLNNVLIKNIQVIDIHTAPIKCAKYFVKGKGVGISHFRNSAGDKEETDALGDEFIASEEEFNEYIKSGHDGECIPDILDRHLPNNHVYAPVKTFLFRNIAITNKYTNKSLVYNLLYLFMKKKSTDIKINLLAPNTKIDLHEGATDFYRNYGFLTNIANVDCIYNIGKKECKVRSRYRHSI